MSSKRKISNSEKVRAHMESGEKIVTTYGQLKSDFMSKKITSRIEKIEVVRTKRCYFASYKFTKGFKLMDYKPDQEAKK